MKNAPLANFAVNVSAMNIIGIIFCDNYMFLKNAPLQTLFCANKKQIKELIYKYFKLSEYL